MGTGSSHFWVDSTHLVRYSKQLLQIANDFPEKAVIQHKACLAVEAGEVFFDPDPSCSPRLGGETRFEVKPGKHRWPDAAPTSQWKFGIFLNRLAPFGPKQRGWIAEFHPWLCVMIYRNVFVCGSLSWRLSHLGQHVRPFVKRTRAMQSKCRPFFSTQRTRIAMHRHSIYLHLPYIYAKWK